MCLDQMHVKLIVVASKSCRTMPTAIVYDSLFQKQVNFGAERSTGLRSSIHMARLHSWGGRENAR